MTWTAQAHDRQGWWNASALNYARLRKQIIAECEAGHLYGPLYVTTPEDREFDLSFIFAHHGLKNVRDRLEPTIDDEEEADACLDDYYLVGGREEVAHFVTEYTRTHGEYEVVTVKFIDTDRHSIRWMLTYRYIEWQIPTAMLRLDTEYILDAVAVALEVIRGGQKRPLKPQTVLAIRDRLGWAMKIYDEMGFPLPEAPAPAEEGSA